LTRKKSIYRSSIFSLWPLAFNLKSLAFSLWPLALSFTCSAQDTLPATLQWSEYRTFTDPVVTDSAEPMSLYLRMHSTSYFKNNEYKNDFLTGYTLVGMYFEPVLEFNPDAKTSIYAGVHLLKYFGRDRFERKLPVISLRYTPNRNFSMIFGTLYGTTSHGLPEPMYDFEQYLTNNYENGIQLLWNYPSFRGDVWLNWEQFIRKGDPFQEKFTVGANTEFQLVHGKKLNLSVPFAVLFRHCGGEIDATNLPAETRSNLLMGFRAGWDFGTRWVKSVWFDQEWIEFLEINPGDQITVTNGRGRYTRSGMETRIGSFELGYWNADDFISPHGMPLFQSVSQKYPDFFLSKREMLILKYEFHRSLTPFLDFALRIEPYYHFYTGRMDHSWSLYLKFNDRFFWGKL